MEKEIKRNKVQAQFFANLSHDLKTPLNLIFTSMQMLELHWNGTLENPNKYINIMRQNCYRLIKLINNTTDITKFDSGFSHIKLKDYNIIRVVEDISLSVVEYIEHKGIKIVFDTDIEEKIIACDPEKIERIMLNLLSNAAKFTKEGGVIWVNIYDKVENIHISVKDTGPGIPQEKQKIIFDRFMQINNSHIQEHEGSGIGLSVVKSLVEMHKGKISCISEYGKGSEFIIELPVINISKERDIYEQITNQDQNDFIEKINIEFSDIYINYSNKIKAS
ncbi:histidine kinase [Anaeromicrobium sediminis]|uniref:histidine kinase n=1 Tax=Anaeromicrobium sediminis TaxID=1478221 RepID=A0A267MB17_9FIRM|nr:histidine kinase [Anaeromicrobium sediminis]